MKLAILGKGGSGKSTLSWLFSMYLSNSKSQSVLAIDADHNMDLAANLNFEVNSSTNLILQNQDKLRILMNIKPGEKWLTAFSNTNLPKFSFPEMDSLSQELTYKVNDNLFLQVLGLGDGNLLYQDMCSHAHSAALKFYLALLNLNNNSTLIVDGVAGTDMLNYGLYLGCDVAIVSLESHINSQRVFDKVLEINQKVGLPTFVVLNKYQNNQLYKQLEEKYKNYIIGKVFLDKALLEYNYNEISKENLDQLESIFTNLNLFYQNNKINNWERLKKFQLRKAGQEE